MNRSTWVRRKQRYEREARERSHAESQAHLDKLRNMTQEELDDLLARMKAAEENQ